MAEDTLNDDARHEVLAENTAQAVHKHLSRINRVNVRFLGRRVETAITAA